jgi:tetratricopeptide (TPR) repeat protein
MEYKKIFETSFRLFSNKKRDSLEVQICRELKRTPNDPELLYYLGLIYWDRKDFSASVQYLERSIKEDKDFFESYFRLADIHIETREYERAEHYLSLVQNMLPVSEQWKVTCKISEILIKSRKLNEAEELLRSKVSVHPHTVELYNSLGLTYFEMKKYFKAKDYFQQASKISFKNTTTLFYLAAIHLICQEHTEARGYLEHISSSLIPEIYEIVLLTREMEPEDQTLLQQSKKQIELILENGPDNSRWQCNLANIYFWEKAYDKACSHLELAIAADTYYINSYWQFVTIKRELEHFEDVETVLKKVQNLSISNMQWFVDYQFALRFCAESRFEEGINIIENALRSYPDNANLQLLKGQLHMTMNDFRSAVEILKMVIQHDQFLYIGFLFLAISYRSIDDISSALSVLNEIPDQIDQKILSQKFAEKRICYEKLANLEQWKIDILKGIEANLFSTEMLEKIGIQFENNKDYSSSLMCLAKILQKNTRHRFS